MNRSSLLTMAASLTMCLVTPVAFAQTSGQFNQGNQGVQGTGGTAGVGASQTARQSGVMSGPRLGTTSNTVTGLGGSNRIDRTSRTGTTNPLETRGINVLGGDASQQSATSTRTTGVQMGGMGAGQFGRNGFNQNLGMNRRQTEQRAQYSTRVAFTPTVPSEPVARIGLGSDPTISVQASMTAFEGSSIHVAMEEGVIVLRGSVATESDRRIAEKVAKLEPGIGKVRNELTVAAVN